MKKYRLKEEAKKYFDFTELGNNQTLTEYQWSDEHNVSLQALEEVEERVKVKIYKDKDTLVNCLFKKDAKYNPVVRATDWTEQERADIEEFLNVFGSMKNLYHVVTVDSSSNKSFSTWLKENKK